MLATVGEVVAGVGPAVEEFAYGAEELEKLSGPPLLGPPVAKDDEDEDAGVAPLLLEIEIEV